MEKLDKLVKEELVAFREKVIDALEQQHPHVMAMISTFLTGTNNQVGLQVVDGGQVVGEYTFNLAGVRIADVKSGTLSSEVHHPFLGIIKPYAVVDKNMLEKCIHDESLLTETMAALPKYLPDITIKFLR